MQAQGRLLVTLLLAGTLTGVLLATSAPRPDSYRGMPLATRVFYLQDLDLKDAMMLLRTEAQVHKIAAIDDLDVLIVTDVVPQVELCQRLLVKQDPSVRAVEPHDPLPVMGTRLFRIKGHLPSVFTVLGTIYEMRAGMKQVGEDAVSVRASKAELDAAEALLKELGMLVAVDPQRVF